MDVKEVGQRLVELCRQGKNLDAINSLYSPDIVSVEAQTAPGMPAEMKGIEAIRGKHDWWVANNETHSASVAGPFVLGDRFAVMFDYEITPKAGPHSGKRTKMEEVAVYTVKNDKIVREEFMY